MKKDRRFWQTPPKDGRLSDHIGFVIFEGDPEQGRVLAARVADPTLVTGENFWKRLCLTEKDIASLRTALLPGRSCWMVTPLGVGILCARYDVWMNVLIYLHIHDDPTALRRLIYREEVSFPRVLPPPLGGLRTHTLPTEQDASVLDRLCQVSAFLEKVTAWSLTADARQGTSFRHISGLLEEMTELLGGSVKISTADPTAGQMLLCHAPWAMEFSWFFWMCLLCALANQETLRCKIVAEHTSSGLVPVLVYEARVGRDILLNGMTDPWFDALDYVICRTEINGGHVQMTAEDLPTADGGDVSVELTVKVFFGSDPAKHPPSGLKSKYALIYDDEAESN